jgi:uncharacterized membrane protein (GlpM family)
MFYTMAKAIVSALIILLVTWFGKKSPVFGGWIAALPLVSLLSAFWLSLEQQRSREIADFLTGVLWGLIPTALLLLIIVTCLRHQVSFHLSLLFGIGLWGIITWFFRVFQS